METGNLQAPIKLKEVFHEISEFFKGIYEAFLLVFKNKSKNSSNAWSVSKTIESLINNVKHGYEAVMEFLPSLELSKETLNMFVPIFSNTSLTDGIVT